MDALIEMCAHDTWVLAREHGQTLSSHVACAKIEALIRKLLEKHDTAIRQRDETLAFVRRELAGYKEKITEQMEEIAVLGRAVRSLRNQLLEVKGRDDENE